MLYDVMRNSDRTQPHPLFTTHITITTSKRSTENGNTRGLALSQVSSIKRYSPTSAKLVARMRDRVQDGERGGASDDRAERAQIRVSYQGERLLGGR